MVDNATRWARIHRLANQIAFIAQIKSRSSRNLRHKTLTQSVDVSIDHVDCSMSDSVNKLTRLVVMVNGMVTAWSPHGDGMVTAWRRMMIMEIC